MKIRLVIPAVNAAPTGRPETCPHCGHWHLHRHGTVAKPLRDHRQDTVMVVRYRCVGCGRTFRHYPDGVTAKDQSQRTVVLAALCYGLGLSCSASAQLLGGLGVAVCAMTVWRDAQAAGETLRRTRPAGRVRVLGADETVYRVKGQETVVGFVTDGQTGTTLDFEVLSSRDGEAFRAWLAPYVEHYGVAVLVSDEHASYGVVAAELGLEHQLCLAHVRKALTKRRKAILAQARQEGLDDQQLQQVATELARIRALVRDLPASGARELEQLHRRYLAAVQPGQAEQASVAYRMRLLTLELWQHWGKLRLYLRRPELGLDGTNNGTERAIGKSKVRYKTMRGYKSLAGLGNGIALTQWLYSGAAQHDLAAAMAA
jgi:transposase-like protein